MGETRRISGSRFELSFLSLLPCFFLHSMERDDDDDVFAPLVSRSLRPTIRFHMDPIRVFLSRIFSYFPSLVVTMVPGREILRFIGNILVVKL